MKAYRTLPESYTEKMHLNLQKDKKAMIIINVAGTVAMILVFIAGHFIVPLPAFFADDSAPGIFIRLFAALLGYAAYMIFHEMTHAAVMKAVGGGKVVFGFTGIYAFAGSHEDYFDKIAYRCIALAPLCVWTIILFCIALALPDAWFWVIWFIQAGNIGGAAGDVYVTLKLWNQPPSILVKDTGIDMTVYDRA